MPPRSLAHACREQQASRRTARCPPVPRPPHSFDAGTPAAAANGSPARHHWHTGPATHAPSAAPPHTGAPPPSPARPRPAPPAQPDTAAPQHPTPPPHPALLLATTIDRTEANRTLKTGEPARSVAQLPELLSASYRNRVRKLSPRNRNQCVQHLPGSHIKIRSHFAPKIGHERARRPAL